MEHEKIVSRLSLICPSEVLYELSMRSVLSQIANRLGEEALDLSPEDMELAIQEIRAAIDHQFDPREYIDMGLDAWLITRTL
jgi:hypothetical protein